MQIGRKSMYEDLSSNYDSDDLIFDLEQSVIDNKETKMCGIYAINIGDSMYIGSSIKIRDRWLSWCSRMRIGDIPLIMMQAINKCHYCRFRVLEIIPSEINLKLREQRWNEKFGSCRKWKILSTRVNVKEFRRMPWTQHYQQIDYKHTQIKSIDQTHFNETIIKHFSPRSSNQNRMGM